MQIVIMLGVGLLVQLLSVGLAQALMWLVRPIWQLPFVWVLVVCLVVVNAVVFGGLFLSAFRLSSNVLAVLWLGALSAVVSACVIAILGKLGIAHQGLSRLLAVAGFVGMLGLAYFNAYSTVVHRLSIKVDKPIGTPVRLAVVSDLHLGALFGERQLHTLTKILKNEQVDVMLMPGDIMDDDTEQFEKLRMADAFTQALNAPKFGTVATLGNHDLYRTHAYDAINRAIIDAGAILLNDDVATLRIEKDGKMTVLSLIGRYDDHHTNRLPTSALLQQVDTNHPVILLDHRPSSIDEHSLLDIDLQVSGHTHKGQIFPANFIVDAINTVGYGHKLINGTHFLVSSGFGFWGVPFRLGSRSEVWVVDLVGHDAQAVSSNSP